ncbi:hypothetical protein D7322_02020 [Sphingobacterium puteale]|uniref:DUF5683 domain-containing protein n=1 Tax=Sphingobacterium puteale TaxID=2420510 RepID=A0A420W4G3_9SPHI|nr:DUF5683 domain-containing protein [Sphingobacterium puteale]RKO73463.1 hypothetical protein D7322_02020 [Sphingobacterium puteale]
MAKLISLFFALFAVLIVHGQTVDTISKKQVQTIKTESLKPKSAQDTIKKESRKERKKREKEEAKAKEKVVFKDSTRLAIEAKNKQAWKRSLVLPGWGQYSNGGLWWIKVPVIYGGLATTVLVFDFNNKYYKELLGVLKDRSEGKPVDPYYNQVTNEAIIRGKDNARRDRDLMVLLTLGVYGLNVAEAYIDSMLKYRWSIGDDKPKKTAFSIGPTLMDASLASGSFTFKPTVGLKLSMKFN